MLIEAVRRDRLRRWMRLDEEPWHARGRLCCAVLDDFRARGIAKIARGKEAHRQSNARVWLDLAWRIHMQTARTETHPDDAHDKKPYAASPIVWLCGAHTMTTATAKRGGAYFCSLRRRRVRRLFGPSQLHFDAAMPLLPAQCQDICVSTGSLAASPCDNPSESCRTPSLCTIEYPSVYTAVRRPRKPPSGLPYYTTF